LTTRQRRRQRLIGLMMIDHDGRKTQALRFRQRLVTGGAAIDGDEELGAGVRLASGSPRYWGHSLRNTRSGI